MSIYKQNNKILTSSTGEILQTPPAIIDIDIDYNYKLNGGDIAYMKNRANPSQTIYQHTVARQPMYNATENAGECDTSNMELYLPKSARMSALTQRTHDFSFFIKGKLKDIVSDRYLLEARIPSSGLLGFIGFINNTLAVGRTTPTTVLTADSVSLVDNYFEILFCKKGAASVSFLNGEFNTKPAPTLSMDIDFSQQNVIFGNTRLSSLKYNGYFKAFKFWDTAIINPDNY